MFLCVLSLAIVVSAKPKASVSVLRFDPMAGETRVLTMPDGSEVHYTAYERL